MSIEKTAFWEWFIVKLEAFRGTKDNAQSMEAARELLTSSLGSGSEVDRIIEKAGNTPDQLIAYFRQVEPSYHDLKEGDHVVVTATEAIAISVSEPEKQ